MSTAGTANAIWNTKVRSQFVPSVPEQFRNDKPWAIEYNPTPPKSPIKYKTRGTVSGSE